MEEERRLWGERMKVAEQAQMQLKEDHGKEMVQLRETHSAQLDQLKDEHQRVVGKRVVTARS